MRKLFKGGNYSRAETFRGNTVIDIFLDRVHITKGLSLMNDFNERSDFMDSEPNYLDFLCQYTCSFSSIHLQLQPVIYILFTPFLKFITLFSRSSVIL